MAIPADILQGYFRDYRSSPAVKKKIVIDIVLFFATTPKKQGELLVRAVNYDILNPVADGEENFLRSSEISVSLFKKIFKQLPQNIDREKFLISVLSNLSEEAKNRLTQRQYTAKTGENLRKTIAPFAIAYHLFLTMVFFDVSALLAADFSRYTALLVEIQTLKGQLRHDNTNTTPSWSKLHNAITHLEEFKLNFLKAEYGLTIEILSDACQSLYSRPVALFIKKDNGDVASAESRAERLQFDVLLELNKHAYGLNNTFGSLRFSEAKPRAHSDNAPPYSTSAPEGVLSFWGVRASGSGYSRANDEMNAYYHFAP